MLFESFSEERKKTIRFERADCEGKKNSTDYPRNTFKDTNSLVLVRENLFN